MTAGALVLLTGFEPFAGRPVNASWEVAQAVARDWDGPARMLTALLPVSFARAPQALVALVGEARPTVVVCLGESGRPGIDIERVALNLADCERPDNDGDSPRDRTLVEGGPVARLATLPVRACLTAAAATGAPVALSLSAGSYVCNATFYALLGAIQGRPGVSGGFVHVPLGPGQASPAAPGLGTDVAAAAVRAVLRAALVG